MHLTCIDSSKEQMDEILSDLPNKNIANILALRGDIPKGAEERNRIRDFQYASDLAAYIRKHHDFCVGGACYPEGHPESPYSEQDIENLLWKVDAGVSFLVTQLFFDNDVFYRFKEKLQRVNVDIPIVAGIMPITNQVQIEKMLALSNAMVPKNLIRIIHKFEHNEDALNDAGIAYATQQSMDLLANGVDGIHIYTMNKPQIAKDLVQNLDSLLYTANSRNKSVRNFG